MPKVRLITNPTTDSEFGAAAREQLELGADGPRELENRLRARYPLISVHTGITEDGTQRWYAYRDGRWVNSLAR